MMDSAHYPLPDEKRGTYTLVVEYICSAALGINLLLIYVFMCCRLRACATYKYFFILTEAQNIISSICFLTTAPRAICFNSTFLFVATGRLGGTNAGPFILVLYNATFASSIVLVTNTFVYKYLQLCKTTSFQIYSLKWIAVVIPVNILLILNWSSTIVICGWPSKEFVLMVREHGFESYQFDLLGSTFMGISMKSGLTWFSFALLIQSLLMILVLGFISLLCAIKIHFYLKYNSMSAHAKRMHRKTLMLLSLQTACPFLLLHIPLYTMYMLLFTGIASSKFVDDSIGVLMSSFTFVSPILTLVFTEDYRNYILTMLFLKKRGPNNSSMTNLKSVFVDRIKPVSPCSRKIVHS